MRILSFLLIFYACASYGDSQELAQKLVDLTAHPNTPGQATESMVNNLNSVYARYGVSPDKALIGNELKALLSSELESIFMKTIKHELSILMQNNFTENEMKQLIELFSTPAGRKYIEKQEIMQTQLENNIREKHAQNINNQIKELLLAFNNREKHKRSNTYDKSCDYYYESKNYIMFNKCITN